MSILRTKTKLNHVKASSHIPLVIFECISNLFISRNKFNVSLKMRAAENLEGVGLYWRVLTPKNVTFSRTGKLLSALKNQAFLML